MRIGYSYWGVCASLEQHRTELVNTPDGSRYVRPMLIDAMVAAGHQVYALQQRRESVPYPGLLYDSVNYPELDALLIEYRWPTYKNSGPTMFESDLQRQEALIDHYRKIPTVVWDLDFKVTADYERARPWVKFVDPSIVTNKLTKSRSFFPFCTDWKPVFPVVEPLPVYGYVGNNYERDDSFKRYYFDPLLYVWGIQTQMYGNWLQATLERPRPEHLVQKNPYVAFCSRQDAYTAMATINRFLCTTHVSKPEYYKKGLLSPRYVEALAAGCPALVPKEQEYSSVLGKDWIVSDALEVEVAVRRLNIASLERRTEIVEKQREAARKSGYFVLPGEAVEILEDLCK